VIPKGGTIPWSAPDAFMRRCLPLLLWAAVSIGGCGGSPMRSNNSCGLTASGVLTDGTFGGGITVAGTSFPLIVSLDAQARSLSGAVAFRDEVQSYFGTLVASIDASGALAGTYTATGDDGRQSAGSLSGVTDNQSACGTWENTAGQTGTWQLSRMGNSSMRDAGVSGTTQPATFLCQPRPDTCPAGTRCEFSCTGTPSFQCMTGDIGSVEYGGICSTAADCIAGSVCTNFRLPDGGIPATGICTAYCNADSDCPFGEHCSSIVYHCTSGDRFTFSQCM
jgi:hypothetical protein